MNQAILFTNYTDRDFTWTWDSEEYLFKAHQSVMLPAHLANHFTKHLVDREMQLKGLTVNHFSRKDFVKKCLTEAPIEATSQGKLEVELMNPEKAVFCTQCDSKGVRHKKECPTLKNVEINSNLPTITLPVPPEFPDLKLNA